MAGLLAVIFLVVLAWHLVTVWSSARRIQLISSTFILLGLLIGAAYLLVDASEGYRRSHLRVITQRAIELSKAGRCKELEQDMLKGSANLDRGFDSFNVTLRLARDLDNTVNPID